MLAEGLFRWVTASVLLVALPQPMQGWAQDVEGSAFADSLTQAQLRDSLEQVKASLLIAEDRIERQGKDLDSLSRVVDGLAQEISEVKVQSNALAADLKQESGVNAGRFKGLQQADVDLDQRLDSTAKALGLVLRDSTTAIQSAYHEVRDSLRSLDSRTNTELGQVRSTTDERWTYTWAGLLGLLLVGGAGFLALRRGGSTAKDSDPAARLDELRGGLDKLDKDLREGMLIVDQEFLGKLEALMSQAPASAPSAADPDHSLALKVADEVTRIEQNLARMDASVKGYKQLVAGVGRMKENLQANGYELLELLNKPFHEGMKLTASFVPDDSLEDDERIIVRVYKPTVLFNGTMIQAGEVQVAQG